MFSLNHIYKLGLYINVKTVKIRQCDNIYVFWLKNLNDCNSHNLTICLILLSWLRTLTHGCQDVVETKIVAPGFEMLI